MTPGRADSAVVRRHLLAMNAAVQNMQHHRDATIAELQVNRDRLWSIKRGLQKTGAWIYLVSTRSKNASPTDVFAWNSCSRGSAGAQSSRLLSARGG